MEISQKIAKFVVAAKYEDLSERAIEVAKKDVLDFVGCALIGVSTSIGRLVKGYVEDFWGCTPVHSSWSQLKDVAADHCICRRRLRA